MPRERIKRIAVAGRPSLRRLYGRPGRASRTAPRQARRKAAARGPAAAATREGPGYLVRLWRDWREFLAWLWMGAPGLWRRPEKLKPGDRVLPIAEDVWWHHRPPNQKPRRWIKHWYQD